MWGKENLYHSRGISWRELQSFRQARRQENILLRLSQLPVSIIGGIKDHPGRSTLLLILALGVTQAINLGKQVIEDQARVQATNLDSSDQLPGFIPPEIIITPPQSEESNIVRPTDLIRAYMADYLKNDLGARTIEKFDKLWDSTTTEPVQIRVIEKEGIWVRDFPDPKFGRRTPSGGPGTGPTWKALYYDLQNPIEAVFQNFIIVKDPKTDEVSIWATRWSTEGGWPTRKQPHFETFAVYWGGQWLVSFTNEEAALTGKTISGKKLFEQAFPPFHLPRQENLKGTAL